MLRVADFYAVNRGGGLFSQAVSQRLGAVIAFGAFRAGFKPTTVTLANLAIGLASSITLMFSVGRINPLVGILVTLGWQLAYAMDCADGQLARVTGQASTAGARLDVLCDVASHVALVTALVAVADPPLWLGTIFAASWMVNIIASVLATPAGPALLGSAAMPVRILKLLRDYGALVLAAGLLLIFEPNFLVWYVVSLATFNVAFLIASITQAARLALATSDRSRSAG